MRRKNQGTGKMKDKNPDIFFEKNFRTSWLQKIGKILCLLIPIGSAFAGYFAASPVWKFLSKNEDCPEIFKFIFSLLLFAIIVLIIFFKTRNTNPIMKIRVLSRNQKSEDD